MRKHNAAAKLIATLTDGRLIFQPAPRHPPPPPRTQKTNPLGIERPRLLVGRSNAQLLMLSISATRLHVMLERAEIFANGVRTSDRRLRRVWILGQKRAARSILPRCRFLPCCFGKHLVAIVCCGLFFPSSACWMLSPFLCRPDSRVPESFLGLQSGTSPAGAASQCALLSTQVHAFLPRFFRCEMRLQKAEPLSRR